MPRLVKLSATGPVKIEPQTKPVWVCACGLSQTFPLCDVSHKLHCPSEQPGTLHVYDDHRRTVIERRPEPPDAPSAAAP